MKTSQADSIYFPRKTLKPSIVHLLYDVASPFRPTQVIEQPPIRQQQQHQSLSREKFAVARK